jgi:hypothetical protein
MEVEYRRRTVSTARVARRTHERHGADLRVATVFDDGPAFRSRILDEVAEAVAVGTHEVALVGFREELRPRSAKSADPEVLAAGIPMVELER